MRHTTALTTLATLAGLALTPLAVTAPAAAVVTCDGLVATIVVPAPTDDPVTDATETDPVTGTPGDDVIVGTAARDTIDGAGGDDTICGLGGDDTLRGGDGDDRIFGGLDGVYVPDDDFWGDVIIPGPGDDYVDLGHDPQSQDLWYGDFGNWDMISFRDATGPVSVDLAAGTATGEGTDTIAPIVFAARLEGSDHDDVLRGTDSDDIIYAGGGDDVVEGRDGDDELSADGRIERRYGEPVGVPGDDVVRGGAGRDRIEGGFGVDVLTGGEGNDSIRVQRARKGTRAIGGPGGDGFYSWPWQRGGQATLVGGPGNDVFSPGVHDRRNRFVVRGGPGVDRLVTHASLKAAPHKSRVEIDARRGTVRMKVGTPIRFSSVRSFGFDGSTSIRLFWWGSRRSESLELVEQHGPVHAWGGGGRDRITGGWGPDLLDGGPGRDVLDGDRGRDRCVRGERLRSCEVRR